MTSPNPCGFPESTGGVRCGGLRFFYLIDGALYELDENDDIDDVAYTGKVIGLADRLYSSIETLHADKDKSHG